MTGDAKAEIRILYFASLGERLGCREESFSLDKSTISVKELKGLLARRGAIWLEKLTDETTRCAVNQTLAKDGELIHNRDEVAFFPPVTGG